VPLDDQEAYEQAKYAIHESKVISLGLRCS
jgi:hypothetical protein